MKARHILLLISLLALALVVPISAMAQTPDSERTVHVEGEATVRVAPDKATVRFGVVTRAETPREARTQNSDAASAALQAVREMDIDEANIRMEQLQLRPHRVQDENSRRMVEDGFEAVRTVRVEVEDVDQVPALVMQIIEAGANRLQSVQYDVADRTAARNDALADAARNARAKADVLATALDAQVGAVHTIHEQSFSFPRTARVEMARAAVMRTDAPDPDPEAYAPGEIEVEARVSVVFTLAD